MLRLPLLLSRQGHRREKLDRVPCSSGRAAIVRVVSKQAAIIIMRPEHGSVSWEITEYNRYNVNYRRAGALVYSVLKSQISCIVYYTYFVYMYCIICIMYCHTLA